MLLVLAAGGYAAASRLGYVDQLQERYLPKPRRPARLSTGDFPAGVAAPVGDVASVPLRSTLIGFTPGGSAASLLLAAGGASTTVLEKEHPQGLFHSGYALDARAVAYPREEDLRTALSFGGENGGVDLAEITVDRLAAWWPLLRDASPRTVLLVSRSRGQEALATVGVNTLAELKGKRIGTHAQSASHFFALWLLARSGLLLDDVRWVELPSTLDAGAALREGRVDAAVGLLGDVEPAARDRGGKVLATSADAPHLIATVLVARGEFAARYPDAIRRVIRGLLDAGVSVQRTSGPAARMLGEVAPALGDPADAIRSVPAASQKDNLAFFGLSGEAPVTYDELFHSAAALAVKLGRVGASAPDAEDTRELGALRYISETRKP